MPRTRIKICGVRRPKDASFAAAAGADAIGIVMHRPAKRSVDLATARQIIEALPAYVTPVLLFVDAEIADVRETAAALAVRHVQLNGDESPAYVAELAPLRVVKAIRVNPADGHDGVLDARTPVRSAMAKSDLRHLAGLVLEPGGTGHAGGSGVENDWEQIVRLKHSGAFDGLPPLIAAGGLTPLNVGDVVRRVSPYAVDVSSGVEDGTVGEKSHDKIAGFIAMVRAADVR